MQLPVCGKVKGRSITYICRLRLNNGACFCRVLSGDLSRHSFSPVFHGKRLYHVNDVGIRVHYFARIPSCFHVTVEVDFAVAKKKPSKRHRVGHWGSERNWKTDCSPFSKQRYCYFLQFMICLLNYNFS